MQSENQSPVAAFLFRLRLPAHDFDRLMQAAKPVAEPARDAMLKDIAAELGQHEVVGPGLLHRISAVQRRYDVVDQRRNGAKFGRSITGFAGEVANPLLNTEQSLWFLCRNSDTTPRKKPRRSGAKLIHAASSMIWRLPRMKVPAEPPRGRDNQELPIEAERSRWQSERVCSGANIMKRVLMASAIAGTFAIATIATPTSAHAQWGRGWGWGLGGLALGLTIAAALSRPAYAYGYGYPAYSYGYGPAYGYASSGYGAGPEGYASYGYGYPAYSYASYGYPGYGYGGGYYRPVYRSAYYGGYRPAYRPAVYGGYRVARRVAIHRARWR